jgi:ZIP family zinc transporter
MISGALFTPHVWVALGVTFAAAMATVLGSALVWRARVENTRMLAFGLAFAGGAMVYVSLIEIWPKSRVAFAQSLPDNQAYMWATVAFFVGAILVALIDRLIPNPHAMELPQGHMLPAHVRRMGLFTALAITAHNFPEGLATFFATLDNPHVGAPLAVAIALHNIPEGIAIALPVFYATGSKYKATWACFLSGLAEPVGALVGYLILAPFLTPMVYGWVFGAIAGAMVFLALDELLPAAKRYAQGHETVYGMLTGMILIAASLVLFQL